MKTFFILLLCLIIAFVFFAPVVPHKRFLQKTEYITPFQAWIMDKEKEQQREEWRKKGHPIYRILRHFFDREGIEQERKEEKEQWQRRQDELRHIYPKYRRGLNFQPGLYFGWGTDSANSKKLLSGIKEWLIIKKQCKDGSWMYVKEGRKDILERVEIIAVTKYWEKSKRRSTSNVVVGPFNSPKIFWDWSNPWYKKIDYGIDIMWLIAGPKDGKLRPLVWDKEKDWGYLHLGWPAKPLPRYGKNGDEDNEIIRDAITSLQSHLERYDAYYEPDKDKAFYVRPSENEIQIDYKIVRKLAEKITEEVNIRGPFGTGNPEAPKFNGDSPITFKPFRYESKLKNVEVEETGLAAIATLEVFMPKDPYSRNSPVMKDYRRIEKGEITKEEFREKWEGKALQGYLNTFRLVFEKKYDIGWSHQK